MTELLTVVVQKFSKSLILIKRFGVDISSTTFMFVNHFYISPEQ